MIQEQGLNRREFLAKASAATAVLLAGNARGESAPNRATVVIVRDKARKVVDGLKVDAPTVQRLVDDVVMALAGERDIARAWGKFVSPKDRVAVKVNTLFAGAATHPEVVQAVTHGLVKAGVDPANIVVYDRYDKDLVACGFAVNREGKGVRICGSNRDYGKEVKAGPVATTLSKFLTEADVLINVPIMKSHVRCAVTGALKNHLGSVANASAFHDDCCAAIADLNALAPIKEKTRICIADALYSFYHGGPEFRPQFRWDYYGVLAAVDPVALDAVLDDIVKAKRVEKGMKPRHNDPKHILRAAELGLGEANLGGIKRVEMEI